MITDDFFASLDIMWKGMAGLFVVCIFIMLVVMAIKFFMRKKKPSVKE
ncbi:MAG: hypothetical protein LBQ89_00530 [Treponema sp.]|jgi:hypothetical protein|nr:hypothetical protein [Treponema sp.]